MATSKDRTDNGFVFSLPMHSARINDDRDISSTVTKTNFIKEQYFILNDIVGKLSDVWYKLQGSFSLRDKKDSVYETITLQFTILGKIKVWLENLQGQLSKILKREKHAKVVSVQRSFVKDHTIKPASFEKLMVDKAERDFKTTRSLTNLAELVIRLTNVIFVLEGVTKNSEKVYYSEYGEGLGTVLTAPMALAKSELDLAKNRLEELEALKTEFRMATKACASSVNKITFFRETKMEDSSKQLKRSEIQYDNLAALKNFIK